MRTISKLQYIEAAQLFHWAVKEHFIVWFTGEMKRHRRTETMLPRLVRKGKLTSTRYGKRIVYCVPRQNKNRVSGMEAYPLIEHGLGCTEGLVRFWRSEMNCEIIPERQFRGFGIVPEWGIRYPNGRILLFEFCTADNAMRGRIVRDKIRRYTMYLPAIDAKFAGDSMVVFVMDVDGYQLKKLIRGLIPTDDRIFFTDYQKFISVPCKSQLVSPIYIWGADGETYPLRHG